MAKFCAIVVAFAMLVIPASAAAAPRYEHGCSKPCVERVKAKKRVQVRRAHRRALAREMRSYRRHPMPACTWAGESSPPGDYSHEWPPSSRYTAQNPNSTASGKFQILTSTWANVGGWKWTHVVRGRRVPLYYRAADAPPVLQERLARVVARAGVSSQWVNC